jgi:methylmalonyl-CoA mutase
VGISGAPWAEAGGHAVLELAGMMAQGVEILRAVQARGGSIDEVAASTLLQVTVQRDTFEELAKLRALRLLWSKVVAACGGGEASQRSFVHAVTSRTGLTRVDPWVNLLRGTHGAFVAAVGGADAITIVPFDRALGVPSELGQRVARNTQSVLQLEAHLGRVVDPAGGSRVVEEATDRLAREAWSVLQSVEAEGGLVAALTSGSWQRRLAEAEARRARAVASRRQGLVGVSLFPQPGETPVQRVSVASEAADVVGTVGSVEDIGAAVTEGAVIAQVGCVVGTPSAVTPVPVVREAAGWEALRAVSEARSPKVFLAAVGARARHVGRSEFAERLLRAGGFQVVAHPGEVSLDQLVAAFVASGADSACICGADADYVDAVPVLAAALLAQGARVVAVAGRPGAYEQAWRSAGLTHALYRGCDALGQLTDMLNAVEVS